VGDKESLNVQISLDKKISPQEFILSSELAQLLEIKRGPYLKIINSFWLYVQLN